MKKILLLVATAVGAVAIQKQIAADGSEIMRMSPSEFARYMDNELVKWGKVVKQAGIKAQ